MTSSSKLYGKMLIAQAPAGEPPAVSPVGASFWGQFWMFSTVALGLILIGVVFYTKSELNKSNKALKFEKFKTTELQKKLKLALKTIQKMEKNPDLVHSREFNLDYLRLRMDEEVFHYSIVNQIKTRVKQLISISLRPDTGAETSVGVANSGRQIDEIFDILYETKNEAGQRTKGVLFRVNIKLTKLPTQSSSATVSQIIDCIEKFLSPPEELGNWQPTIQGRVVIMHWDQKAKPTPLLVIEQSSEGVNVSFRTDPNRRVGIK